jgi:hypothetical protein
MNATTISLLAFACFFGGGLLGMWIRGKVPEHHLADDSRHLLETGLGIIGTVGGLVLGLLVGSAFGSYNTQRSSTIQMAANTVVLDRILAHYGPEAKPVRRRLRAAVAQTVDQIWPPNGSPAILDPSRGRNEVLYDKIEELTPVTDEQRTVKGKAIGMVMTLLQQRWLMYEQLAVGVSPVLLTVLIFWFTVTFIGLGIFTRPNTTVITALFLAAIALSGALYILQEMYTPFQGPMQIPSTPLRAALVELGR